MQYWDPTSGDLKRTEAFQERWQRIDKWDLPVLHLVSSSSGAGFAVRSVSFADLQLLTKAASR